MAGPSKETRGDAINTCDWYREVVPVMFAMMFVALQVVPTELSLKVSLTSEA
jgi:hypothetical protein